MYQKMTHTLEDLKKLAAMELRDVNREELVDIFRSGAKSLSPCALSTPSLIAMKRTPFCGKIISVYIPTCR